VTRPIRLHHKATGRSFIVDGKDVYADKSGDGKITRADKVTGEIEGVKVDELLKAATYFDDVFENPHPGSRSEDGSIVSGGRLNAAEVKRFEQSGEVPEKRKDVWGHLDFFDADGDGKMTVAENYEGWRDMGFGRARSLVGTVASAMIFGKMKDGLAIDVENIQEKRPSKSSAIYDRETGDIDRGKLDEFLAEFDARGDESGVLTHDQLKQLLEDKAGLGRVSRGQFGSLMELTEKLNGSKTITKAQFEGMFDSSLLYLAKDLNKLDR
jgi:hypothetical protein